MRYRRFIIKNYRAIVGPLEIRVDKGSPMPIIGINESGKTTVLQAIFAFDYYNDGSNEKGRHLNDVSNLYHSSSPAATVEAEVDTTPTELKSIFVECGKLLPKYLPVFNELANRRKLPSKLTIRRTITTRGYTIPAEDFGDEFVQNALGRVMLQHLPYILYFDDFRDKIAERIEIPLEENKSPGEWFEILEELFTHTNESFSLYKLAKMEVRQRKTVLSPVQRNLNQTLTREWQSFRLDDRDALKIHIEFEQQVVTVQAVQQPQPLAAAPPADAPVPPTPPPVSPTSNPVPPTPAPVPPTPAPVLPTQLVKNYIKLEVVETDQKGYEHFFFISDRSKGFYWFFNFVMKLEFNPKISSPHDRSIYLLDEPGSYLHAYAQRKLCTKLRQISEKNHVIYCTHSHYLLDPEIIPINGVMIADKNENGSIHLTRMIDYREKKKAPWSALQPVLDALQIKPYAIDLIHTQTTVITEGIYDYYCLELFRDGRQVSILPCLGADSIKHYIPLMIAWQVDFRTLWDNDAEGRKQHAQAQALFGENIAARSFRVLPCTTPDCRWIMQNMFDGSDLVRIRHELGLAEDTSFERTVLTLFYSSGRESALERMTQATKLRFKELFDSLNL